ncbi:hypothetical protein B9J78_03125 [bacterium Unc6]|nr:hypothetical protein [bacterium Unc6]
MIEQGLGLCLYKDTGTVDAPVRRIRSKIETTGKTYIETTHNVGYRLCKDI